MFAPPAGLCSFCLHVKTTGNRRGSIFFLCQRSLADASFRRYPVIPVLACRGFEPQSAPAETQTHEETE